MRDEQRWLRRRSILKRTGPDNLAKLAVRTGYGDPQRFPGITEAQLVMGTAGSWRGAAAAPRYGAEEVLPMLQHAISYLVRDLFNRVGDLNLIAVAPIIDRLPNSAVGWEAVIRFIHRWPAMRMWVHLATYRQLVNVHGRFHPTAPVRLQTLDLPLSVHALLRSTDQPPGVWIHGAFTAVVPSQNWSWLTVDFAEESTELPQQQHPDLQELPQQQHLDLQELSDRLMNLMRDGFLARVHVEGGGNGRLSGLGLHLGVEERGRRRAKAVADQLWLLLEQRNAQPRATGGRPFDLHRLVKLTRYSRGAGPSSSPVGLTMTTPEDRRRVLVWWTIELSPPEL